MALNRPQSVFNSNDLLPSLSIATASIKDKEMDDKTLVLLEEEMERSFVYSDNQTSMPNDENHLLT